MVPVGTAVEGADELARLTDEEVEGLRDFVAAFEASRERMEEYARAALAQMPEARELFAEEDPQRAARTRERWELLKRGLESKDISEYLARLQEEARELSSRGVRFATLVGWLTRLVPFIQAALVERLGDDRRRLVRALNGLNRLTGIIISAAGAEYADVRESLLQQEHRRILRELSVPVVPVWHGVLVVPLVGTLDSTRARELTQTLLEAVARERARVVILDITGVPAVDTQVADYLLRTVKAARLLGAHSLVVGIRPAIAQTLVRLGVELEGVHTEADLQSGLEHAFRLLGYRIVRGSDDG